MEKAPISFVNCGNCFATMTKSKDPVITVYRSDGVTESHYLFKCPNNCIPPQVLETPY